jgi:hypothetical protein
MEITEPNEGPIKTNEANMMVTKIITVIAAFLFNYQTSYTRKKGTLNQRHTEAVAVWRKEKANRNSPNMQACRRANQPGTDKRKKKKQ